MNNRQWYDPENGNVENEIAWTQFHLSLLYKQRDRVADQIDFQEARLVEMYRIQSWWKRFINYCRTGK